MSELEQVLQQRIKQLEAGEPLEACSVGLPEQEAKALHLIATILTLSIEDVDEESIVAQRADVMRAAAIRLNGTAAATPAPFSVSLLAQLRALVDRLWANWELSIGLAALLIIVLFGLAWRGMTQERIAGDVEVVASETESNVETIAANPIAPTTTMKETESAAPIGSGATAAPGVTVPQGSTVYIPLVPSPLSLSPRTAVIEDVQGLVEIQTGADTWTTVSGVATVATGQRVRTGELSQANISFYDGSQAHLSANTEIAIDELNALPPEEGYRTVVMTQWEGNSDHDVQFRNDGGSRYEVKTPAGSGIARGTKFHVLVTPNSLARYIVTEGKVDVTGHSRTVSVTAGQLTSLIAGSVPDEPAFNISGEGEVTATGAIWTIAGQTFQTYEYTIVVGNPQVGDLVHVDGHLLSDGNRMADRIVLLRRAVSNRFSLSGEVEAMGAIWTIAGQTILVNEQTVIEEGIAMGDNVRAEGLILSGGTLQAQVISRLEETPGLPFQFSGIVQVMNESGWTISGQSVALDEGTSVDHDIVVGAVVTVRGWILEDGTWIAAEIHRQDDDLPSFEFTGVVQSLDPWQVAGIGFETRPWTIIAPGISIGDLVRVQGSILSDGTWVAVTITPLSEIPPDTVIFFGVVASINPWVVNGLPLVVTGETLILGNISVGSLVKVQAQLLPDGTWTVLSIQSLYPDFGVGCLVFSSPVIAVNADTIQVKHWKTNINRIHIQGDVTVNSIVTLPICGGWDGTIIISGNIVVIYQPVIIIIDDGSNSLPLGCKITGKGGIKCSHKSQKNSR